MNTIHLSLAAAMALSLGIIGCDVKSAGEKADGAAKTAGNAVGDAAKATGNAVGDAAKATGKAVGKAAKATAEYLSPSDDSIEGTREELDSLEKKWKDMLEKAEPATAEAKADLQKAKDQMGRTIADARAMLAGAKDANAETWLNTAKPRLDALLLQARKLYDDMAVRFGRE